MYTAGFEDAMKKLTVTMAKEKKLDVVVKEFEVSQNVHVHVLIIWHFSAFCLSNKSLL